MSDRLRKRNFILGVLNGAIFRFGWSFVDHNTVLPVFVSLLTSSKIIIGSVTTMRTFGWFMPQLFVASFTEHWERRKPVYILGATLRASSLFLLFLIIYLWGRNMSSLLLPSFLILYGISCMGGGLTGLPFLDIIGKVITPRRRGKFFSLRLFLGGVLSVGGGLIVRYVLAHPRHFSFPDNYALLFLFALLAASTAMLLFTFVREPTESPVTKKRSNLFIYLKNIGTLLQKNRNYNRFFWGIIFLNCGIIALPFYVIYGRAVLHFTQGMIGVFISAQMIGAMISALFWGFLSDRHGNKIVIQLSGFIGASVPLLVMLTVPISTMEWLKSFPQVPEIIYSVIFVLIGMNLNGLFIGQTNLLLEIAPRGKRATYIGVTNTAIGLTTLLPLLGGYIIQRTSYTVTFSLSLVLMFIGIFFTFFIVEPRNRTSNKETISSSVNYRSGS